MQICHLSLHYFSGLPPTGTTRGSEATLTSGRSQSVLLSLGGRPQVLLDLSVAYSSPPPREPPLIIQILKRNYPHALSCGC